MQLSQSAEYGSDLLINLSEVERVSFQSIPVHAAQRKEYVERKAQLGSVGGGAVVGELSFSDILLLTISLDHRERGIRNLPNILSKGRTNTIGPFISQGTTIFPVLFYGYALSIIYILPYLRMGSCCPPNLPPLLPPPQTLEYALPLHYDQTHPMFQSYLPHQGGIFQKGRYIWHSIPITTPFRIQNQIDPISRPYFQVRNREIKDDNFVVGIITHIAMRGQIPMPWTTVACLCFESHQAQNQSAVIFNKESIRLPRGVRNGQVVRVTLETNNWINFSIQGASVHRCPIPNQLRHDDILPYVALFSPGDRIEFLNEIRPERR